jgi:hypothetical protein
LASVRRHYTLAKSLKYTLFLKKLVILLVTSFWNGQINKQTKVGGSN